MRSFVEFMLQQDRVEMNGYGKSDYETIRDNCDVSTLGIVWFTTAVKLAIEANNPNSDWGAKLNPWNYEVDAMLTAYYRSGYITAMEYCTFRNTFYHWMRCNYRARNPFKLRRGQ